MMRRATRRLVIVMAAGLVLAGCGADGAESPDEQGAAEPGGQEETADDHDMDMDGVGEPADAADADRTIEVTALDTMAYEPSTLTVEPGETVTFVVTNAGEAVHEFTLGDQAMQDEHAEEMAEMGSGMGHDEPNSLSLEPGETKELTWRFGEAGSVIYACHEPGHYAAGMRGEITVG